MSTSLKLPLIDDTLVATTRYLQALTVLDERSVRRPSLLPGWTRAHVVAHLSRNADAFVRVLEAVSAGEPAAMYPTQQTRDDDIAETVATHDLAELLDDARASCGRLESALLACDADPDTPYSRLDGEEATFALSTVCPRRRSEVEIHHADLGMGYAPATWPPDFSTAVVEQRQAEMSREPGGGVSMVLASTDVDGVWKFGEGPGPDIEGTAGDLAYWLVGRGTGVGLTYSSGDLPVLGRWR